MLDSISYIKIYLQMKKSILIPLFIFLGFTVYAQNFQWAKTFTSKSNTSLSATCIDDGDYVYSIGGFATSDSINIDGVTLVEGSVYMTKHDISGNLIWAKSYPSRRFSDITYHDGSIFISGDTIVSSESATYLAKVDTSGNIVWSRTSNTSENNKRARCIAVDKGGNIFISGTYEGNLTFDTITFPDVSSSYIFLVKYDSSGTALWGEKAGPRSFTTDLAADSNGNVFMIGDYQANPIYGSSPTFGPFSLTNYPEELHGDSFLAKYDGSGTCNWIKTVKGIYREYARGVAVDTFDNVYFVGHSRSDFDINGVTYDYDSERKSFYCKYSNDGTFQWAKQIGGQAGKGFYIDASNNIFIGGTFYEVISFDDIIIDTGTPFNMPFVAKSNTDGDFEWAYHATTNKYNSATFQLLNDITVSNHGEVFVVGRHMDSIHFDDMSFNVESASQEAFFAKLNDFIKNPHLSNASLCPGSTFYATYTPGVTFDDTNTLTLQLSDETGDFSNASNLSFTLSSTNDTLFSELPSQLTPSDDYKLRILTSSPSAISPSINLIVHDVPIAEFTYSGETTFCSDETLQLSAYYKEGYSYQWLKDGNAISEATDTLYTVTQSGDYSVSVSTVCDTLVSEALQVTVHILPNVELSNFPTSCSNHDAYELTEGTPVGGAYTGSYVNDGYFYPSNAGIGTHTISYTYTDENECTSTASKSIQVLNPPSISLSIPSEFCIHDEEVTLDGGSPSGGTYFGTGVNGTTFNLVEAGLGTHIISYTITNSSGCSDTVSLSTEVIDDCSAGLYENETSPSVFLYPNPTNNSINIKGVNSDQIKSISIFDTTGKLIIQQSSTDSKIDISMLQPGTYLVDFELTDSPSPLIFKVVKR